MRWPEFTDARVLLVSSRSLPICNGCTRDNWASAPIPSSHRILQCNGDESSQQHVPDLASKPASSSEIRSLCRLEQRWSWTPAPGTAVERGPKTEGVLVQVSLRDTEVSPRNRYGNTYLIVRPGANPLLVGDGASRTAKFCVIPLFPHSTPR